MPDNALVANPFGAVQQRPSDALAVSEESKAVAEIQSMLVIAKKFPRDVIRSTDSILRECSRPTMAEVALYSYSRGGTEITGPSIRLAEAIARSWGNVEFGFREVSRGRDPDGVTYSEIIAYAWDLENNTRRPASFRVRHWRDTRKGGYAITDERDIYELTANQAQRRVRACILAVIPGDVVEAAQRQCEQTLHANADTTPDGIKKMVARFAEIGVTKEQIEARIQRRIETIQPAQVIQLRNVFNSIRDGMSSPSDWFDAARGGVATAEPTSAATAAPKPAAAAPAATAKREAPAELPAYPDAQFAASLPAWRDMIESGKKTPEAIIAVVSGRYCLTDEQREILLNLKPAPAEAEPESDQNADWFAGYDAATEESR